MDALKRMLGGMFGRKRSDTARDPAVVAAASDSHEKANRTQQLVDELRSRTEKARLDRARLHYDEGLHGNRGEY